MVCREGKVGWERRGGGSFYADFVLLKLLLLLFFQGSPSSVLFTAFFCFGLVSPAGSSHHGTGSSHRGTAWDRILPPRHYTEFLLYGIRPPRYHTRGILLYGIRPPRLYHTLFFIRDPATTVPHGSFWYGILSPRYPPTRHFVVRDPATTVLPTRYFLYGIRPPRYHPHGIFLYGIRPPRYHTVLFCTGSDLHGTTRYFFLRDPATTVPHTVFFCTGSGHHGGTTLYLYILTVTGHYGIERCSTGHRGYLSFHTLYDLTDCF